MSKETEEIQLIILEQEDDIAPITEADAAWDVEMDRLWRRNLIAAGLHFINGGAGIFLLLTVTNIQDFKIPLTTMFLNWDSTPY